MILMPRIRIIKKHIHVTYSGLSPSLLNCNQSRQTDTVTVSVSDTLVKLQCVLFYNLQMQFMLLFSRQGKLRLQKWYEAHPDKLKKKITRELITTILSRKPKMCSFLEWKDLKIVYKRYKHH